MGTVRTRSKPERRQNRQEENRREAAPRNAAPPLTPAARIETLAGDPSFMTSLARGLTVIEAFSGNRHHPTTSVLSAQTGLSRAAVHRCLYTLRRLGFVDSDDERHFYLRPSVLSLGYSYLYSAPLASATQPVLERVSRFLHESCSIATLEGDSIVYVARSPVTRIMSVDLRVGSRLPAFCTSMGRVLLASVSPEKLRAYVAQLTLTRYTDRTIASKEKLLRSLPLVERAGYAIVDQEFEIGLRSIAVPLRDSSGTVVAALNASTHAQRISLQEMQTRFLPALQAAAQELSLLLAPEAGARSFALAPAHQNDR
ncbi:MAG: IclR family transcriptional regulator C-terminal domain-containing protein [Terriglobales bacterium]